MTRSKIFWAGQLEAPKLPLIFIEKPKPFRHALNICDSSLTNFCTGTPESPSTSAFEIICSIPRVCSDLLCSKNKESVLTLKLAELKLLNHKCSFFQLDEETCFGRQHFSWAPLVRRQLLKKILKPENEGIHSSIGSQLGVLVGIQPISMHPARLEKRDGYSHSHSQYSPQSLRPACSLLGYPSRSNPPSRRTNNYPNRRRAEQQPPNRPNTRLYQPVLQWPSHPLNPAFYSSTSEIACCNPKRLRGAA